MAQWNGNRRGTFDTPNVDAWDPLDLVSYWCGPNSPHNTKNGVAAVAQILVDWRETDRSHIFKANLPGLKREDVKVQVEESGRILQISGELKTDDVEKNDKWHRFERHHGTFSRRFRLPENADVDQVDANMKNGVLTVTVPKTAETKPKIKIIDISGN